MSFRQTKFWKGFRYQGEYFWFPKIMSMHLENCEKKNSCVSILLNSHLNYCLCLVFRECQRKQELPFLTTTIIIIIISHFYPTFFLCLILGVGQYVTIFVFVHDIQKFHISLFQTRCNFRVTLDIKILFLIFFCNCRCIGIKKMHSLASSYQFTF